MNKVELLTYPVVERKGHFNDTGSFSIVIPAYNEENRISPILKGLNGNESIKEIIVIFDGNDNTPKVAESIGKNIKVIKYSKKLGRGGAIIEGLKAASGDVVVYADADNAAPWYEVLRLAKMVNEDNPCIVGSRWRRDSNLIKREGAFKIFVGRIWHYLIYFFLNVETKDVQCGLKCFSKELISEVLPSITTSNRLFDVDLIYNIKQKGYKIKEIGIDYNHNEDTKMPYIHMIPVMFLYLFGIRFAHSRFGQRFKKLLKLASNKLNEFH